MKIANTNDSGERETVLVTGGSGLVGRAIQEEVEQHSSLRNKFNFVFISSRDTDLTDKTKTILLFKQIKPQFVINLAAACGGLYFNERDNLMNKRDQPICSSNLFDINLNINTNVLNCSKELKLKKCISCLSTCIFPAQIEYPIVDCSKLHLGPPHPSNSGYSLAKRQVDLLNRELNESSPSSLFTAIVPTNIYGKHDNFKSNQSHVIPGLIMKAHKSASEAISNRRSVAYLDVCGSGKPLRQFIYARDLAKLILWVLNNYNDPEPLILSPDEADEVSIGFVAQLIATSMSRRKNVKVQVRFDETQSDGQYRKTVSNKRLRELLPESEFNFKTLENGIDEVIDWFCSSYPNIRK